MTSAGAGPAEARYDDIVVSRIADVPVVYPEAALGDPVVTVSFRVGVTDESIADRGLTHLAEHRALQPLMAQDGSDDDGVPFTYDGFTGPTMTSFSCTGTQASTQAFVSRLCEELASLAAGVDADTLHHEARILRAESRRQVGGGWGSMLHDVYGVSRLGMGPIEEAALYDLDPERLRDWVARYFVRQNCTVTMSFPPVGDLGLTHLATGRWQEPADLEPQEPSLPAYRPISGPLAFLAPVRVRLGYGLLVAVIERSLVQQLRMEDGVSYAPWATYEGLSADWGLVSGLIDVGDTEATGAVATLTDLLDRLGTDGPRASELRPIRALAAQQRELLAARTHALVVLGDDVLFRKPLRSPSELAAAVDAMRSEDFAPLARSIKETLLAHVPAGTHVRADWLRRLDDWEKPGPVTGKKVSVVPGLLGVDERQALYVSDGSLTLQDHESRVQITRESIVGVFDYMDGTRRLLDRTGYWLILFPGCWMDEDLVFDSVDALADEAPRIKAGVRFGAPPSAPIPAGLGLRPDVSHLLTWLSVLLLIPLGAVAIAPAWDLDVRIAIVVGLGLLAAILTILNIAIETRTYRQVRRAQLVYEVAEARLEDEGSWRPGIPPARAYVLGGLVLAWLDRHGLLAEWVRAAGRDSLADVRVGDAPPSTAFRELDGILASDMLETPGREFTTYLWSPDHDSAVSRMDELFAQWNEGADLYDLEDTPDVVKRSHDDLDAEFERFLRAIWLHRRIHKEQYRLPRRTY